jgi:hypothetical protein
VVTLSNESEPRQSEKGKWGEERPEGGLSCPVKEPGLSCQLNVVIDKEGEIMP